MFEQHRERNLSMVMDFYELTMSNGYFHDGVGDVRVAFDVFYRKNPGQPAASPSSRGWRRWWSTSAACTLPRTTSLFARTGHL